MKEKGHNRNCGLGLGIKLWFSKIPAKRMRIFQITRSHTSNQRKRGRIIRIHSHELCSHPKPQIFGDKTPSIPPAHRLEHCNNPPQTSIFMPDLSANEILSYKSKNKMFKRLSLSPAPASRSSRDATFPTFTPPFLSSLKLWKSSQPPSQLNFRDRSPNFLVWLPG